MLMRKRGISAIVATVLIILITVAAVTIIWVAIIPMITKGVSFQDPNLRLDVVTSGGYTFYDATAGLLYVQVRRGTDDVSLTGMDIVVTTAGNSVTTSYGPEYVPAPNQAITIKIAAASKPDNVKVIPILASGGTSKVGSSTSQLADVLEGTGNASATPTPFVNTTGGCTAASQCDDGVVCTFDNCTVGTCTHTTITTCSMTSDGCCAAGCNPTNDADCSGCANDASCPADTYECSALNRMLNDNFCNISGGYVCAVTQTLANNCNDSNNCTTDTCAVGGCSNVAVANGVSCGGTGTCQSGTCVFGPSCSGTATYVTPVGAVASSVYSTSYPATKAIDGVASSSAGNSWFSTNVAAAQWIYFDMGSTKCLSGAKLYFYHSGAVPITFKLEVSNDGTTWADASTSYTVTSSSLSTWLTYTFTEVSGRYLRVYESSHGTWGHLTEITVSQRAVA